MAKEVLLSQATLDLNYQKWLAEEEESRRLIEEQRQRDRVAQREPSAASGKVPRASHVVPPNYVMGRPIFKDAPRDWAQEQQKEDKLAAEVQHCADLFAFNQAVRVKPVENALAYLARQALLSQLPSVSTHKPGAPRK